MRMLIIGPQEKFVLETLREKAEAEPFSFDDLLDIYNKNAEPAGDRGFAVVLSEGFRVVFTHEENGPEKNMTRHLSVSVDDPRRVPSPDAISALMAELGFKSLLKSGECHIYMEKLDSNGHQAVNIIEYV